MPWTDADMPIPPVPPGMSMAPQPSAPPPAPVAPTGGQPAAAPPQNPAYDALMAGGGPLAQTNSLLEQNRAAMEPKRAAAVQAGQDYAQTAANPPKPPQQAAPDPQHGMGLEAAGTYVMVATALGAIAGALTRRSTTNALAAFTGALEGVAQGNKQAFEENKARWEQENKRINQQLQQSRDAYLDILNSKKINFEMKMMELQQEATRQHDDVVAQAAARRDMITIGGLIDKRQEFLEKGSEAVEKLDKTLKNQRDIAQIRAGGATNARQLDDAAIQAKVDQLKKGFPPAEIMRGLGRADIAEINNRFAGSGGDAGKVMEGRQNYTRGQAAARVGGGMEERIDVATNEMKAAIPLALEASNNLPRGNFVPINQLRQMGQQATSNPAFNDFLVKNNALVKAYGRAMNPQGVPRVTENAEARADGILSKAISREAYETQAKALWQEAQNVQKAVQATRPGGQSLPEPTWGSGAAGGGAVIRYDAQGNPI